MTIRGLTASAALVALTGSTALAGNIRINESVFGGAFTLNAGNFSPAVFGLGNNPPNFTDPALLVMHADINSDLGAGSTNDIVTILTAFTTHGLTFFALFDEDTSAAATVTAFLSFDSEIFDTDYVAGPSDINTWRNDQSEFSIAAGSSTLQNGQLKITNDIGFNWDPVDRGDAFAASGLENGDRGTWSFDGAGANTPGLGYARGFQFLSWNGGTSKWEIAHTGVFNGGTNFESTSFDWDVIPLPSGGGLAGVGLLIVGARRRRIG